MLNVAHIKAWARRIGADVIALWIAARDPRTPRLAKLVAALVAAYALSPIDLIPDFLPVIGYLDDLLIVPLGILLAVRLIPAPLLAEFRERAAQLQARPVSRTAAIFIILLWLLASLWFISWLLNGRYLHG